MTTGHVNIYKLAAFDLDGTIVQNEDCRILLRRSVDVIKWYKQNGFIIALVSHNTMAPKVLEYHNISDLFDYVFYTKQHYYGMTKMPLFAQLQNASQIPYKEWLFFDDLFQNIFHARQLEITAIQVWIQNGVTFEDVKHIDTLVAISS
jgi:HAD superfamily phosphatase (TIGR01681 family)